MKLLSIAAVALLAAGILPGCRLLEEIALPEISFCYKHEVYGNFCVKLVGSRVAEVNRADDGPPVSDEEREAVTRDLEGRVEAVK